MYFMEIFHKINVNLFLKFVQKDLLLLLFIKIEFNQKFREGKYRLLITTDVAARGLDIPEVDLVIVTAPPKDVESYIHRSGRTGRAGAIGKCICLYKSNQMRDLRRVEIEAVCRNFLNKIYIIFIIQGIQFKRIEPPRTEDVLNASSVDAAR